MITRTEITFFWVEFLLIEISRFSLSLFGFPLLPFALILKYGFGVKDLWLLNDTKDGDFGDPLLLEKYGYTHKSKVFKFIWWWFRNHSWNYYQKFKPDWNGGETVEFKVIKDTTWSGKKWIWCERNGVHGTNYVAYRVYEGGKVFCRFSMANKEKERKFGAGGDGYKFHRKPAII